MICRRAAAGRLREPVVPAAIPSAEPAYVAVLVVSPELAQGDAAVEKLDEVGQQLGFGGFENHRDLPHERAFGVDRFGGGDDTRFAQGAAVAELAVELVEVGLTPGGEELRLGREDAFEDAAYGRIGGPIERLPRRGAGG